MKASPDNSNSIQIDIVTSEEGDAVRLELYRLPKDLMLRLLQALSDAETVVRVRDKSESVADYLLTEKVIQRMEGET